jgi:Lrp/AsnC family leucine-responsive transcriptional regulator
VQRNGKLSDADLAREDGVAPSTVQRRRKRLEADGHITQYVALLDPERVGMRCEAFVEVFLASESRALLRAFDEEVHKIPAVLECHRLAASSQYLLKVICEDLPALDRLHIDHILTLPGVLRTERRISVRRVKATTELPL